MTNEPPAKQTPTQPEKKSRKPRKPGSPKGGRPKLVDHYAVMQKIMVSSAPTEVDDKPCAFESWAFLTADSGGVQKFETRQEAEEKAEALIDPSCTFLVVGICSLVSAELVPRVQVSTDFSVPDEM